MKNKSVMTIKVRCLLWLLEKLCIDFKIMPAIFLISPKECLQKSMENAFYST